MSWLVLELPTEKEAQGDKQEEWHSVCGSLTKETQQALLRTIKF